MKRNLYAIIFTVIGVFIYLNPLRELSILSLKNPLYSHFLLIPIVSVYFLYLNRKRVFSDSSYSPYIGMSVVIAGLAFYWIGFSNVKSLSQNDFLFLCTLGFVTWLNGGFIIFYGTRAYRQARFPLLFLVFMIPIPLFILDPFIRFLQVLAASTVHGIFEIIDIPYIRRGLVFELPGLAIEVAKECSGIRSSLALFITSIIAGYMFLDTGRRRVILGLSILPITIFKNALRIITLALMAVYVDPSWLTNSWLHRAGGKPFFILGLCLLLPILLFLRRSEKKEKYSPPACPEEDGDSLDTQSAQR